MRGEQAASVAASSEQTGPSPHARGADDAIVPPVIAPGTIPACAGSSSGSRPWPCRPRDHPRVRGEQSPVTARRVLREGPSPRARGADTLIKIADAIGGTIPACAGSSWTASPRRTPPRDHPRVRGEQMTIGRERPRTAGPSPRARGAGHVLAGELDVVGTIPACTGSSPTGSSSCTTSRDHPRVHGEQVGSYAKRCRHAGPSPRARGAVPAEAAFAAVTGTIPACTGSSAQEPAGGVTGLDHPRVRGEQGSPRRVVRHAQGPSPRARGAAGGVRPVPNLGGTIPACTGSSCGTGGPPPSPGDHPRVHGEQFCGEALAAARAGPSPRARGAEPRSGRAQAPQGTIPACTGSS